MDNYYGKSDVFSLTFLGVENLSSNKESNPTSFSAAFSAFQLCSFDVLFDFPVIVFPLYTTFIPTTTKTFMLCSIFCLFVFFEVSDVGCFAINLTYSLFVSHFPVSLSLSHSISLIALRFCLFLYST